VNVRPLTRDDADAVAALVAADYEALLGRRSHVQRTDVLDWWSLVELARDSWLFHEDGEPVAAGWFQVYGDKGEFGGIVGVGSKGRGLGTAIAERSEACARTRGLERVRTFIPPEDAAAVALFRGRSYEEVRRFYEMAIELQAAPPAPSLPDGLVLDEFREEDAHAFHAATIESFEDHWEWHGMPFDEWWERRRDEDHSLWFLVRDGAEIAAVVRNEAGRNGGGYVGIIGVRRPWRGRGLGKALLHRTFGEFWRRGVPRVTLGVDAESLTGATKLYESVGMSVESAMSVYER
jgi:mycothiol synthase